MFKIKRLQYSFEKKILNLFINWKRTTQNFKSWKSNIHLTEYRYQIEQEETRKLLNQQELQIYQSIYKFKMNHLNSSDSFQQLRNFQTLQLEIKVLATLDLKGQLRDKINFNNRKSELLMELYSALEEVQAESNMTIIEYKIQQLEILGLVKGQLSNQYIDFICKLYLHKDFWFALNEIFNEMLKQRMFNSNFAKIAKCLYIIKPDCQLYEIIIDLNIQSEDQQIEKIFHLKAIEVAIKEGYQHSLKFHLEQCLYHSWNQDQKVLLIRSCLKLSKRFEEREQLYEELQNLEEQ